MIKEKTRYTEHGVAIRSDEDLVYSGRARKRPPGASAMVQRIFTILNEHPAGMTVDDLLKELSPGWMEYDAYRDYDQYQSARLQNLLRYGTPKFIAKAQRRWVQKKLIGMVKHSTPMAKRQGKGRSVLFFAGDHLPKVMADWCKCHIHLVEMDVGRAARELNEQVKREQVMEMLRKEIRGKGKKGEVAQLAHDYIKQLKQT